MNEMLFVQIDDRSARAPAYRPSYAILFDPTPGQVASFARAHQDRFVFTFLTGSAESAIADDWNGLPRSDYVVKPIYIGTVAAKSRDSFAQQIVARALDIEL